MPAALQCNLLVITSLVYTTILCNKWDPWMDMVIMDTGEMDMVNTGMLVVDMGMDMVGMEPSQLVHYSNCT